MTDESFLQETSKEIWRHLCTSLHAFLNLYDSQFVLDLSHVIFTSSFYLELIKSYRPFQTLSYLLNKKC